MADRSALQYTMTIHFLEWRMTMHAPWVCSPASISLFNCFMLPQTVCPACPAQSPPGLLSHDGAALAAALRCRKCMQAQARPPWLLAYSRCVGVCNAPSQRPKPYNIGGLMALTFQAHMQS